MRHFEKPDLPLQKLDLTHLSHSIVVLNFTINEFNPTFEVQNMGYKAFQNALFSKHLVSKRQRGLRLHLGNDSNICFSDKKYPQDVTMTDTPPIPKKRVLLSRV